MSPLIPARMHRRMALLPDGPAVLEQLRAWSCEQAERHALLWVGRRAPEGVPAVRPAQAGHWLGCEREIVVFEAGAAPAGDALAIVAGLLRGGGVLILLADSVLHCQGHSPFQQRWCKALEHPGVERPDPMRPESWPCLDPAAPVATSGPDWTPDQRRVLEVLNPGPENPGARCEALTAPRGRGKSTVLGECLGQWLLAGKDVILTAPRAEAAGAALERAAAVLGAPQADVHQRAFRSPAVLLDQPGELDILMVDEAAALPVEVLLRLAARTRHLILATTTGGFEGSGQGFRLRALPALRQAGMEPSMRTLETPVRWAADDPLEHWLERLFLLDARSRTPAPQAVRLRRLQGADLGADPAILEALTGLLADAHYRTRPSDLQRWLDTPELGVHVLEGVRDGTLFAAALVQAEPGLDASLAEAVAAGERRPPGHFLPCQLAAAGALELAGLEAWRVHRMAVHPAWQGRGLGSRLLRAVEDAARAAGTGLAGASFGVWPGVLRFWVRAGYRPVRIGFRPDAASGQVSVAVLKPLEPGLEAAVEGVSAGFARDWRVWRAGPLRELDQATAKAVERASPAPTQADAAEDAAEIRAFVERARPFEWVLPAMARRLPDPVPEDPDAGLLHAACVRQEGWEALERRLGVSGRRGVIRRLRDAAGRWFIEGGRLR